MLACTPASSNPGSLTPQLAVQNATATFIPRRQKQESKAKTMQMHTVLTSFLPKQSTLATRARKQRAMQCNVSSPPCSPSPCLLRYRNHRLPRQGSTLESNDWKWLCTLFSRSSAWLRKQPEPAACLFAKETTDLSSEVTFRTQFLAPPLCKVRLDVSHPPHLFVHDNLGRKSTSGVRDSVRTFDHSFFDVRSSRPERAHAHSTTFSVTLDPLRDRS